MAKNVEFVNFLEFIIDMDNKNIVYLKDDKGNTYSISKYIDLDIKENNINLKVKDDKGFNRVNMRTYSNSTKFLTPNINVKEALKEFYNNKENIDKDVFVLEFSNKIVIGKITNELNVKFDIFEGKEQDTLSETSKKEKLKAYETPTNLFDVMFGVIQKNALKTNYSEIIIKQIQKQIRNELEKKLIELKDSSNKKEKQDIKYLYEAIKSKDGSSYVLDVFASMVDSARKHYLDTQNSDIYNKLKAYIMENYKDIADKYIQLHNEDFPFLKLEDYFGITPPKLPFIDFQAGSGAGILNSATQTGTNINLYGTEIRGEHNLKEESKDPRYKVFTNIDFMLYSQAFTQSFKNQTLYNYYKNTPIWSNPPYTADNIIIKKSIDVLSNGQFMWGLFPVSEKNYLADNINGIFFEVSKELTGYTDDKVPNKMLFIIGNKTVEELNEDFSLTKRKINIFRNLHSTTVSEAIKEIQKVINENADKFKFGKTIKEVFDYHTDSDRLELGIKVLKNNIDKLSEVINNQTILLEYMQNNKESILEQFGSEAMLLKTPIFPDTQYFNVDGKTQYLAFKDIIDNQGVLSSYRDNYPEILELIKKIAKNQNINLPIQDSPTSLYNLANPILPKEKDKIITKDIGLMKNYYLPSSFDLLTKENKEIAFKIIKNIYDSKKNILTKDIEVAIKDMLDKASKIVTKYETNIKNEKEILKNEVFVLIDYEQVDIGKLQISKTDFYSSMEELGYFSLDNYIELAQVNEEQKEIVMTNFLKDIENSMFVISEYNKMSLDDMKKESVKLLAKILLLNKYRTENKILEKDYESKYNDLLIDFVNNNKIKDYFNQYLKFDKDLESKFFDNIKNDVLFRDININDREKLAETIFKSYDKSSLDFFEFKREQTEEFLDNLINDVFKRANKEFLSEDELTMKKLDIFNFLSQDYIKRKAVFQASFRMAKLFAMCYSFTNLKKEKQGLENKDLFDEVFKTTAINTFGLMPHQAEVGINFLGISDEKKVAQLFWEMRAGKSLASTFASYILSLYKSEDMYIFLESKNIDDILIQIMSHLPLVLINSNLLISKSNQNNSIASEKIINTYIKDGGFYPNLPNILKSYFVGRGDMTKNELKTFAYEFENLIDIVKEKQFTKDYILENYKDSKFLDVLNISCMKN